MRYLKLTFFLYSAGSVLVFSEYFRKNLLLFVYLVVVLPIASSFLFYLKDMRISARKILIFLMMIVLSIPSIINDINNILQIVDTIVIFMLINLMDISPRIFSKYFSIGVVFGIILTLSTVAFGLVKLKLYVDPSGRLRIYFGFINPNSFSLFMLTLALLLILWQTNIKSFMGAGALIFITYVLTGSRSVVLSLIVAFLSFMAVEGFHLKKSLVLNILIVIFLITLFFEFFMAIFTPDDLFDDLDKFFSYRLTFLKKLLGRMERSSFIFGGVNREGLILDNSYARYLAFYGLAFLETILVLIIFLSNSSPLLKRTPYLVFFSAVLFYSLFEGAIDTPITVLSSVWWFVLLGSHVE